MAGAFIISLDFEKMWGVRDVKGVSNYIPNLYGVDKAVPAMLELFTDYNIHATFATVGFLFAENKAELLNFIPEEQPSYSNKSLSPYLNHVETIGENEAADPLHYSWPLIDQVRNTPNQEMACHTFSHYYCLERGQTIDQFDADISAACAIAARKGINLKSLVFPRNQFNADCVEVIRKHGFHAYRGNERSWLYQARSGEAERKLRRAGRLLDSYIRVSDHNCYSWNELAKTGAPYNIPASRFLRPFSRKMKFLESLRLQRITSDMSFAARNDMIYHLWWHPHNFGINLAENLAFLRKVFEHFKKLQDQFGFTSLNMMETANRLQKVHSGVK